MDIDITYPDSTAETNCIIRVYANNLAEGNVDPGNYIVLEPGAGTTLTIADHSLIVVRNEVTSEPPVETSVGHLAGETTSTVAAA